MTDLIATYQRSDPGPFDRVIELHRDADGYYRLRFKGCDWWINPAVPREAPQAMRQGWVSRERAEAYIARTYAAFGEVQEIETKQVDTDPVWSLQLKP